MGLRRAAACRGGDGVSVIDDNERAYYASITWPEAWTTVGTPLYDALLAEQDERGASRLPALWWLILGAVAVLASVLLIWQATR